MGLGYAIALIAVLTIVFTAGGFYLRYRIYRDLNVAAREGDLDRFFAKIDGFGARFALSVFARERLRFIALTRRGDKDQMVEAFNGLMGLKLNDRSDRWCLPTVLTALPPTGTASIVTAS